MRIIIVITLLILCFSCTDDGLEIHPYFAEVYPQVLDEIDIECTPSVEEYYIYAIINGQEFCHDQEKVGDFKFSVQNKFTTSSPTISTGEVYDDAKHGISLRLGNIIKQFNEHFLVEFPDFDLDRDAQKHLDSLIDMGMHEVMGAEHVFVPEGTADIDRLFLESGSGYLKHFLITLNSIDLKTETGGISFKISSVFGSQEGSYLRFNEVKKTFESDDAYYYLDIGFECNLYHHPQYGYEGLWGEVRNGRIVVKLKFNEY